MPTTVKCTTCNQKIPFSPNEDVCYCWHCGAENATGQELRIRKELEGYRNHLPYPKLTVGRAIGYAASIYEFSTHNQRIDVSGIEDRLKNRFGSDAGLTKSSIRMMSSRSSGGLVDSRTGLMIYTLSGNNNGFLWDMIYVIFRGSRGDKPGVKANHYGAGWDESGEQRHQIDWSANFNNQQTAAPWDPGVKVHRGFLELYESTRDLLLNELGKSMAAMPHAKIVCTGHSLGAALATLCAHDLQHSTNYKPFCYPFCVPKVGNSAFARDYEVRIAGDWDMLACEPNRGMYPRGITFVQADDLVSWGSKHAWKNYRPDKVQKIADKKGIIGKAYYNSRKTESKTQIYYLAPNVYKVRSIFGLHSYKTMESDLLGKRQKV